MSYRYRIGEDGVLILQVLETEKQNPYVSHWERTANWRDAKVTDLPIIEWMTAANNESPKPNLVYPNGDSWWPK